MKNGKISKKLSYGEIMERGGRQIMIRKRKALGVYKSPATVKIEMWTPNSLFTFRKVEEKIKTKEENCL